MKFLSEIAQDISNIRFIRFRLFGYTHPVAISASAFLGAPIELQLIAFSAFYAAGYENFPNIVNYLIRIVQRLIGRK